MITVLIPTANRPAMLRTALQSVERQTAKEHIALIIVSENAGSLDSAKVCEEFPSLPIRFVLRDPPGRALAHGEILYAEAAAAPNPYVAVLHDDDWWGIDHIANGLRELQANPDAIAYWAASFYVHGERSWFIQFWNMASWIASGFAPLTDVVKLDRRQAALACLGGGAAHYSSLIAEKRVLSAAFVEVARTGNQHDSDRLLFIELARSGPLLVNLIPEVFIRQHDTQDQLALSYESGREHIRAATRAVVEFCREYGIDPVSEYARLYEQCPIPGYRPYFLEAICEPRAVAELRQHNALPFQHLLKAKRKSAKWYLRELTPPFLWRAARRAKRAPVPRTNGEEEMRVPPEYIEH